MQRGIHKMTALLRPTLGPHPRSVAVAPFNRGTPELLDDGGLIARRMIQLPDRDEDVGAMFLRGLLWRVYMHVGDGVATTGVLFQSVFDEGLRAIAAGCNAMRVRRHLDEGLTIILEQLERLTIPVDSEARLLQIAHTACQDQSLAQNLGEMFFVLGEHGHLEVRSGQSNGDTYALIEGAYWETSVHSMLMLSGRWDRRVEFERSVFFISDLDLDKPQDLVPLLTQARETGAGSLIVIARKISQSCIAVLLANSGPSFQVVGVHTPEVVQDHQAAALQDLESLIGGRAFRAAAGDMVRRVRLEDLGQSRRAWVDRTHFGIIGPAGDPRRLRMHVRELRRQHRESDDPEVGARLRSRIARLSGACAVLWVGGATVHVIDKRKDLAKRTAAALRAALRDGALPGAAVALSVCRRQVANRLALAIDADERAAYHALLLALEEPLRALMSNSGYDSGKVLAAVQSAPVGHGWDVRTGRLVDVIEAGILDPAAVTIAAIRVAVEGAAQALTVDTVIHRRNPHEAVLP